MSLKVKFKKYKIKLLHKEFELEVCFLREEYVIRRVDGICLEIEAAVKLTDAISQKLLISIKTIERMFLIFFAEYQIHHKYLNKKGYFEKELNNILAQLLACQSQEIN